MSSVDRFESASGLRPASAFVAIACVLGVVAARGAKMSLADEGAQPANARALEAELPAFELLARDGTPLALSVDRLQLVMSPNAMWQAHTPDHMARAISAVLGGTPDPEELVELMLPDAEDGIVRVATSDLSLDAYQAERLARWLARGTLDDEAEAGAPVRGMWVLASGDRAEGRYEVRWEPRTLLSEEVRGEQGGLSPLRWSRRISDALLFAVHGRPRAEWARTAEEVEDARRAIWQALMPACHKVVLRDVPASAALPLMQLFEAEWVNRHQMSLLRRLERRYPVRGPDRGLSLDDDPPFQVLGTFGVIGEERARRIAEAEVGYDADGARDDAERELLAERVRDLVYEPRALNGIEHLCARLLDDPRWSFLERRPERYDFLANQAPREPLRRHFREVVPASEVPCVRTTIDVELQRAMRATLEDVMREHDPALTMAIAIELSSGDVLAVDALDAYGVSGFLPVLHTFTPGSTFKIVTMATALDAGVVEPHDEFDTFDGHFTTGRRAIHEAEGAPRGWITASRAIADSCNAVLAQIGQLVPDRRFRETLVELGYGRAPGAGLGPERPGLLPPLPWKRDWTHASLGFGHEISVTFWQHAAALAAVVRGGEWRPLNLIDAVEQNGEVHPIARVAPRSVFTRRSSDEVRAMMVLGAREGTGDRVSRPDLVMGTKTGTAEKVSTELCLHVELAHRAEEHACSKACLRALRGQKDHRRSCYTSSMCTFGRLADDPREVLVFVVVDEPRGKAKYGADVAGKAAVAILSQALGADGPRRVVPDASGFASLAGAAPEGLVEQPWAEMPDDDGWVTW